MRRSRFAIAPMVLALLAAGCVHREIEIMTRPPGARVEFNGQVLEQTSPVRFPFYWYGTHEIVVSKPGYFRERLVVHIAPPWYQQFPIDIFADLLWPGWIYDIRSYPIALDRELPLEDVPDDERAAMREGLIERGEQFRRMAREALGLPPPPERVAPPEEPDTPPPDPEPATPEPEQK